MAATGELRHRARNLLCITLTCPYRKACPCLNPIHDQSCGYTRGIFSRRQGKRPGPTQYFICAVLPVPSRLSVLSCLSDSALWQEKQRELFSTGMRRQREPAAQRFAASLGQIQAHKADLLTAVLVPYFFLLCQASPQLVIKKGAKTIVKSRETIGFFSIVHKEPIWPSL